MYRFLRDMVKIQPMHIFRQMNALENIYLGMIDSLFSSNLDVNRWLLAQGSLFFLDVNGYDSFGSHYANDARKSRGAFYTREQLLF